MSKPRKIVFQVILEEDEIKCVGEYPKGLSVFPIGKKIDSIQYGVLFKMQTVYIYRMQLPAYLLETRRLNLVPNEDRGERLYEYFEKVREINAQKVDAKLVKFNIVSRDFIVVVRVYNHLPDRTFRLMFAKWVRQIYGEKVTAMYKPAYDRYRKKVRAVKESRTNNNS